MDTRGQVNPSFSREWRVGWLADLESLALKPTRLAELQASLGLDTLWLESGHYHTAGFKISEALWRESPFLDWRQRPGLTRHFRARGLPEGAYPVLPGILAGADDTLLLAVIDAAKSLGVAVWGHLCFWSYGGMVYPELSVRDVGGRTISPEEDRWGAAFCPNKNNLNTWMRGCLEHSIASYPLAGIEVDHARYPPPGSLPNLFACACEDCASQADTKGINLKEIALDLVARRKDVKQRPSALIQSTLGRAEDPLDLLDRLLGGSLMSQWLDLRALFISEVLMEMTAAAHSVAQKPFSFGIDVFPPSVAILGGHDYPTLKYLDYLTGSFGLIGWEQVGLSTCKMWTRFLLRHWPDLEEQQVLKNLYRIFGYAGIPLPERLAGLERPDPQRATQVVVREIERMASSRPAGPKVYPLVSLLVLGVQGVSEVYKASMQNGLDGVMIAGLERLGPAELDQLASSWMQVGG
jgi:hypothetical protein